MPRYTAEFTSTALTRGAYDTETEELEITFGSGRTYTFENVPEAIWNGLRDASSPGTYFTQQIKGRY
jgi:hypothetical protein